MVQTGQIASVSVWRVPASRVPGTLARAFLKRPRRDFVKICGTTRPFRFDATATDPRQWLVIGAFPDQQAADRFDDGPVTGSFRRVAALQWRARLRPLQSRGTWAGHSPFTATPEPWTGPVLALTRARLTLRGAPAFLRAAYRPALALERDPSVLAAFGFGEAPVGVQGTLSLWPDRSAMRAYAYAGPEHRAVIARTREVGWYAEDLFASFAVTDSEGTPTGARPEVS